MSSQPYLIANQQVGLERDLEPFLLPDTAYPILEDAFIFRGRVKRRNGFRLLDRFRRRISLTGVVWASPFDLFATGPYEPNAALAEVSIFDGPNTYISYQGNLLEFPGTAITNITNAPQAVVTAPGHAFNNGDQILIQGVDGIEDANDVSQVNDQIFTISNVVPGVSFELTGFDTTNFTPYVSGGTAFLVVGTVTNTPGNWIITDNLGVIVGPVDITFQYFPCLPAMGLSGRELTSINFEDLIGFDTVYAYRFNKAGQIFQDITLYKDSLNPYVWTGSNSDFFWDTNYYEAFWATNYVAGFHQNHDSSVPAEGDGIRWYDGTGWTNFNPTVNDDGVDPQFLKGCLIILPYKDRLVCLNTYEGNDPGGPNVGTVDIFRQRARWSQNGTPYPDLDPSNNAIDPPAATYTIGTDDDAWREDIPGKGGYIDAPTDEMIVSAAFVKDILIVYFERSTWRLRYTGNEILPFVWERINSDMGSESTFSAIQFDEGSTAVGDKGISICSGNSVQRIDDKIPDQVYEFSNLNDGVKRVHGIRQFTNKLTFWTYVDPDVDVPNSSDVVFPNRMLVYNYRESSFSIFKDSFTVFGNFQQSQDVTWDSYLGQTTLWEVANFSWRNYFLQARYPSVVAGNQQGFVVQFTEELSNDITRHIGTIIPGPPSIMTSADHGLEDGQFIEIRDAQGVTNTNGIIFKVSVIDLNTFSVEDVNGTDNIAGTYIGYGKFKVLNNFNIVTKRLNPFLNTNSRFRITHLNILFDRTSDGELVLDVLRDQNSTDFSEELIIPTSSVDPPSTGNQDKLWYRLDLSTVAQFLQLKFFLSEEQMFAKVPAETPFTLHALLFDARPTGRLIGFS